MSLSVPAGRREKEIDVFAAAAFTEGFDETGEFAYAAESVAAPEGCTALFDACAPVDYYAFIQGNLYAYSGGVRVPLIAFTGIPARVSGTAADGKDCDVFCGDGKIFTFSGSASAVKTGVGSDGMENAYKNRLVRVSGGKIFLSAPFAPFDFGTAGAEIQPPATAGKVLRAVEADGALAPSANGESGAAAARTTLRRAFPRIRFPMRNCFPKRCVPAAAGRSSPRRRAGCTPSTAR